MTSQTLGKTSLAVTRIGLGLAALGRPGYINLGHASDLEAGRDVATMETHAHRVLDAAYRAGVRYFDAARSYGRAEAFLASWLDSRAIVPGEVTVGSKWGYTYTAGWQVKAEKHEIKEHSLENLLRQASESREVLGSYLQLYQIHSATLDSGVLDDRTVLEELALMKGSGLKIGLSLTGPLQGETLRRAIEVTVAGDRLFDCVEATWNLLESSAGAALAEAHAIGMGVIVKEALANGRLTARNNDPAFSTKRKAIEQEASRLGTTPDALALASVLARPWVDVVLSGAATVEQLGTNLAASTVVWDQEIDDRLHLIAEGPEDYWATRSRLPWN